MLKPEDDTVIHNNLRTPKSAAVAGIVFSLLMFTIFGLLRRSIPADPLEPARGSPPTGRRSGLR
jgi:hypothetical protein